MLGKALYKWSNTMQYYKLTKLESTYLKLSNFHTYMNIILNRKYQ